MEAIKILDSTLVDVVISDIQMPGIDGFQLLHNLNTRVNAPAFIAMTVYDTDQAMLNILKLGAKGYVVKSEPLDAVLNSIYAAASGGTLVSPEALTRLVQFVGRTDESRVSTSDYELSPSAKRVLHLLCSGYSNQKIADRLGMSLPSIKKQVSKLLAHFKVDSRSELIVKMHKQ